jgi:Family of unknown function (DUF5670)
VPLFSRWTQAIYSAARVANLQTEPLVRQTRFCLIESRRCVAIQADSIERNIMLWTIIVILVVLWLLGFIAHIGGGLIHLLLVIAVIILIINLIRGRRGL